MISKMACGFFVFLALAGSAAAQLTIVEDFEYSAGSTLNGLNGGTNWGGAWTGSLSGQIASPSLDFPSSPEAGNKAILNYSGETYTLFRPLNATINETAFTSVTLSFLFNLTGNDSLTGIRFAGLSLFNGGTEEFFFGKPGNTTEIGFHKYAGGETVEGVDASFSSSTVFRFTAQITFNPTGNDTMSVSILDNSGAINQTWNNLNLGSNFAFDRIRLIRDFALSSSITPEFDEIEINAIPEPSALGLISAAALAFLARRRLAV